MVSRPITNTENIINSQELFIRINWLQQQLNYRCSDEYSEELKELNTFLRNMEAVASVSAYDSGTDLIRDSYLEEYTKAPEGSDTANASRAAFSPVDFNGTIYWLRQRN
jgi:hypothetical protein